MDKLEFNDLELQQQVEYINYQLSNTDMSVTKVCKDIGIDRSTVRKRFERMGFTFNKDLNLYEGSILNEGDIKEIAPIPYEKPPKVLEENKGTNTLEDRVRALEVQLEALQQMVHCNPINTTNTSNADIELITFDDDTVTRAYRVYEEVQKDFKIFCKKHSEHKVQDIISTALVEFMNKRK